MLNPAAKWTAGMVPRSIQNAATQAIEKTLLLAAQAGGFSVDHLSITKEREKTLLRKRAQGVRLKACDKLAKRYWTSHCAYAAAQGATTGLAGVAGFVAEIPLILSITIREIRTIGLCYGFPTTQPEETNYLLHVLRLGSTNDPDVRLESLTALKAIEGESLDAGGNKKSNGVKYLISMQQYARSLAVDLMRGQALQLIPIAGAVAGASFNAAYANEIGRAAYLCYRRRFLLEGE